MRKKLIILLLVVALLPLNVFAKSFLDGYNTMNLVDTVAAEGLQLENKDYKEDDKQAVVYLFRGDGCGYCHAFISFLNSISKEYGKYFKLVSFEVWGDSNNSSLMKKVAQVTGEEATGVPYIIIGEKVFGGYSSEYDDEIKSAIKAQYNDPSYDVMKEVEKKFSTTSNSNDTFAIIFWNAFIIVAATVAIIIVNNKNTQRILEALNKVEPTKKTKKQA